MVVNNAYETFFLLCFILDEHGRGGEISSNGIFHPLHHFQGSLQASEGYNFKI